MAECGLAPRASVPPALGHLPGECRLAARPLLGLPLRRLIGSRTMRVAGMVDPWACWQAHAVGSVAPLEGSARGPVGYQLSQHTLCSQCTLASYLHGLCAVIPLSVLWAASVPWRPIRMGYARLSFSAYFVSASVPWRLIRMCCVRPWNFARLLGRYIQMCPPLFFVHHGPVYPGGSGVCSTVRDGVCMHRLWARGGLLPCRTIERTLRKLMRLLLRALTVVGLVLSRTSGGSGVSQHRAISIVLKGESAGFMSACSESVGSVTSNVTQPRQTDSVEPCFVDSPVPRVIATLSYCCTSRRLCAPSGGSVWSSWLLLLSAPPHFCRSRPVYPGSR